MSKIIIEFSGEEAEREALRALKALDFVLALWEIQQELLRKIRKYGYNSPTLTEAENDAVTEAVSQIEKDYFAILEARGIDLDQYVN